ncbi:MAG TPA: M20/M25/M40 family metallo-hydrolase [Planctomycetota bacterium]|nr:M20/M25/M40 family metallo-hydrolase [Planctomycetota bacterium]
MRPFRPLLLALALLVPASAGVGQDSADRAAEILKKIDSAIQEESAKSRKEILDLVRQELRGSEALPKSDPKPSAAGTAAEKAKAVLTVDLLKKHASYLASDELEGRCAGYPGCDKAAVYIVDAFKKAGLKPGGDAGGWTQKFRLMGRDTQNVIGVIEGHDPELKNEVVVLGAHYDHVGTLETRDFGRMGGKGDDTIWNGADDNASGTTCVIALAQAFGQCGLSARRTIVFICFSGEEAGLVGSRYYTNHPLVPLEKHAFMLNLDMVGRNPTKALEIHGVGSAEGGVIRRAAERAVAASGLKSKLNDAVTLVGGDSDHSSFADKRVPYAFFFSGFHADYHRPSDHAEKLAYDNMVKVANTAMDILLEIGNLDEKPKFSGRARPALNLPDLESATPPRRMGVTVQELDDNDCDALKLPADQGGLRVDAVQAGSAAQGAGVMIGDVVLSLSGTTLPRSGTREELRRLLTEKVRPGKDAEIVVLRKGERITLKAKWNE